MVEERGEGAKVGVLIEKATNSTDSEVHLRLLKAIKLVVRYSDAELRVAAQTLMDLMKPDHSQVGIKFVAFYAKPKGFQAHLRGIDQMQII